MGGSAIKNVPLGIRRQPWKRSWQNKIGRREARQRNEGKAWEYARMMFTKCWNIETISWEERNLLILLFCLVLGPFPLELEALSSPFGIDMKY